MLATDFIDFHRWILASDIVAAPGIVLHGFPALPPGLAAAVAGHVNEFDDDGAGRWTAFAPELLNRIATSPPQRGLLLPDDGCKDCPPASPCGRRKILQALARRGYAVVDGMLAVEACAELANVFRVSLGPAPGDGRGFHLILRPELFCDRSLVAIIGDTYLEWAAARDMSETV